ncbi:hypothetical protein DRE_02978 [Drechslerella stenobrocha 248]|uniref:F-box domain-containing protein n=1 Tax=Drechslerella stenobrocha 248 TaxID=1043628 RepID=W7I6G6_9PEZI|nr:hypothetical protein DRE_02978 [Drechslerella stenobrocha 248]
MASQPLTLLQLPMDVFFLIITHVSSYQDLKNLALTCSAVRTAVAPRLYRRLVIYFGWGDHRDEHADNALQSSAEALSHVRLFKTSVRRRSLYKLDPEEREQALRRSDRMVRAILRKFNTGQLETIGCSYGLSVETLAWILKYQSNLKNLKLVDIALDSSRSEADIATQVATIQKAHGSPKLVSLSCTSFEGLLQPVLMGILAGSTGLRSLKIGPPIPICLRGYLNQWRLPDDEMLETYASSFPRIHLDKLQDIVLCGGHPPEVVKLLLHLVHSFKSVTRILAFEGHPALDGLYFRVLSEATRLRSFRMISSPRGSMLMDKVVPLLPGPLHTLQMAGNHGCRVHNCDLSIDRAALKRLWVECEGHETWLCPVMSAFYTAGSPYYLTSGNWQQLQELAIHVGCPSKEVTMQNYVAKYVEDLWVDTVRTYGRPPSLKLVTTAEGTCHIVGVGYQILYWHFAVRAGLGADGGDYGLPSVEPLHPFEDYPTALEACGGSGQPTNQPTGAAMAFKISCPRLSPLQSRVAASSFATAVLIAILVLWTLPPSAYSQSIPNLGSGHHLHHVHQSGHPSEEDDRPKNLDGLVGGFYNPVIQSTEESQSWADTDAGADVERHDLLPGVVEKRQQGPFLNSLVSDERRNLNIEPGEVQLWGLDTEQLFAGADKDPNVIVDLQRNVRLRTVYFNFNLCWYPEPSNTTTGFPPTLTLYASNSTTNKSPGPSANPRQQIVVPVVEGFANVTLNASSTVYVAVAAPNITAGTGNFTGVYNYDIIASTKEQHYGWFKYQNLYLIDSDSSNALLISGNETSYGRSVNVSTVKAPYTFFAHPANDSSLTGLRRSWCGMTSRASLSAANGDISMTRRGLGSKNNETAGGWMFSAVNLTTKSDGNCRVIYDLEFCSEVAYAVPTNATIFDSMPRLARFYDTYASSWYANFSYSLQQVQCNTSAEREYSHLRGCADCDRAYKTWLCATTIPRCADYSSDASFLAVRERREDDPGPTKAFLDDGRIVDLPSPEGNTTDAAGGSGGSSIKAASRNALIDEVVSPGPYKEIKPCMDLCWSLVQSCPASLGFSCPDGARGEQSYGWRSDDGDITCSYLGAAYFLSGVRRTAGGGAEGILAVVAAGVVAGLVGIWL